VWKRAPGTGPSGDEGAGRKDLCRRLRGPAYRGSGAAGARVAVVQHPRCRLSQGLHGRQEDVIRPGPSEYEATADTTTAARSNSRAARFGRRHVLLDDLAGLEGVMETALVADVLTVTSGERVIAGVSRQLVVPGLRIAGPARRPRKGTLLPIPPREGGRLRIRAISG
jgi:hypothetical protein